MSHRLRALAKWDLPLEEVSGLALRRNGSSTELLAVGDSLSSVLASEVTTQGPGEFVVHDLRDVARDNAQFEAVAVDDLGRVAVLQESPKVVTIVELGANTVVSRFELVAGEHHDPSGWGKREDGQGEGLLHHRGAWLVGKEKRPAGLLAFEPPSNGSAFASAWWSLDELNDLSDVCLGPDGHIYVLSDQSECIARLGRLDPDGGEARLEHVWRLDVENAEGLVLLDDFTALVAIDQKSARGNLLVFPPLIADATAVENRDRRH